ncbi:MAG TPA: hypothetical protein ENI06_02725 [Spirochaetales bacterium]|nr:hypothetical protein [Spirochaetales bacterium]
MLCWPKSFPYSSLLPACIPVESDSPVLGPSLKQRNEPANIPIAVKAISELKEISQEELIGALAANTRRLYSGE